MVGYLVDLWQVFTSASTMVFKTFACDYDVVEGESYLRADYSLSCKSDVHKLFRVYAIIMILVSIVFCCVDETRTGIWRMLGILDYRLVIFYMSGYNVFHTFDYDA